jgi:hypothetical protein
MHVKNEINNTFISQVLISLMDNQTYQIIGAAPEVHKELGCGFLEPVYQQAVELELSDRQKEICVIRLRQAYGVTGSK